MQRKNTIGAILCAIGYTPETLAADIGVTVKQAKRILSPDGKALTTEFMSIIELTGIQPNILMGCFKPGEQGATV